MKPLAQNTDEWHDWRKKHVGASDVPAIMGTCDFKNAEAIFRSKVYGEKFEGNWATQRGKALEPVVLAMLEDKFECRFDQPSVEFPGWKTLSASLDGLCLPKELLVEIKVPSRIKHIGALCGYPPDTYVDQLQTQMLVTGIERVFYCSFSENEPEGFDLALVEVRADKTRQGLILERAKRFWDMVASGVFNADFLERV